MKSFIAFTAVYVGFAVGLVLGVSLCAGIGYCLGWLAGNTTAGVFCGIAWYCFGFTQTIDQLAESTNQRAQRILARL